MIRRCNTIIEEFRTGVLSLEDLSVYILYVYDCISTGAKNARRISFTKRLFGYTYRWRTRGGWKTKRKDGLLDLCPGARRITDSAILVPEECQSTFDTLFTQYRDILKVSSFAVMEIISEHVF